MAQGTVMAPAQAYAPEDAAHVYVRMRRRYVCITRNPIPTLLRAGCAFLRWVGVKNTVSLLLHQLGVRPNNAEVRVELPVPGTVCLPVQRGYLVVDLERRVVVHVVRPRLASAEFHARCGLMVQAARLSFAPHVLRVDPEQQWYEAQYLDGPSGLSLLAADNAAFVAFIQRSIVPLLVELIHSRPVERFSTRDYVYELAARLEGPELAPWPGMRARVGQFAARMLAEIERFATPRLRTAFTHGDFVHPNLIPTREGLRVVDWECAGVRSQLHDYFALCISQIYWGKRWRLTPATIARGAHALLDAADWERLDLDELALYRRVFYLERLAMIMGREFQEADAMHLEDSVRLFEALERDHSQAQAQALSQERPQRDADDRFGLEKEHFRRDNVD